MVDRELFAFRTAAASIVLATIGGCSSSGTSATAEGGASDGDAAFVDPNDPCSDAETPTSSAVACTYVLEGGGPYCVANVDVSPPWAGRSGDTSATFKACQAMGTPTCGLCPSSGALATCDNCALNAADASWYTCFISTAYNDGPANLLGSIDYARNHCVGIGVFTDLRDGGSSSPADASGE